MRFAGHVAFFLALAGAVGLAPPVRGQDPASPHQAGRVPDTAIRSLRAKWISPEAKRTDADKIRRYESILREGRAIQRRYPQGENLYMVRALMLQATRALLMLNVSDLDREEVIRLAESIVESDAPPGWRIEADVLLTQLELAKRHGEGQSVRGAIEGFVDRYEDTKVIAQAVMRACDMARMYEDKRLVKGLTRRLQRELIFHPGVGSYLMRNGHRVSPTGRSFRAQLQAIGREPLDLPLEVMGRTTLVFFWDPRSDRNMRLLADAGSYARFNRDRGIRLLGIAMGDDTERIKNAAKQARADILQAYLPEASASPMLETFGVTEIPLILLIGADGKVHSVPRHHTGIRWSDARNEAEEHLQTTWRKRDRLKGARCGMVLLEPISRQGGQELRRLIDEILQARLLGEPQRSRLFATLQDRAGDLMDQAPADDVARLVLVRLMLERWQDLSRDVQHAREAFKAKADSILSDAPDDASALAADYFATLRDVQGGPYSATKIRSFVARHSTGHLAWAAELLATVLGFEAGLDDIHQGYRNELLAERGDVPAVYGFCRDVLDHSPLALLAPRSIELSDLQGRAVRIPDDFPETEGFVLHFWNEQAPIASAGRYILSKEIESLHTLQASPGKKVRLIAVYVGDNPAAARELADKRPEWIHAQAPKGWHDPLVRQLDIARLPSSWLLGRLGSVLADDTVVDLPDGLEDVCDRGTFYARNLTGYDDWERNLWRLFAYLQVIKVAPAMFGPEQVEKITRQREDHIERTLSWVKGAGSEALSREHGRVEKLLKPMIDTRKEAYKPAGEDEKRIVAKIVSRNRSIEKRLRIINELVESDLWDPIRKYGDNPVPGLLEELWMFHYRDGWLNEHQEEFLDSLFQRVEPVRNGWHRWRMVKGAEDAR
jgi:hypothetical protein